MNRNDLRPEPVPAGWSELADSRSPDEVATPDVGRRAADPAWLSSFLGKHFAPVDGDPLPVEGSAAVPPSSESDSERGLKEAARSYSQFRQRNEALDSAEVEAWLTSFQGNSPHAHLFRDLHVSDPRAASRLAEAVTAWPEVGDEFLGFRLLTLLGRGAFGKVFLAEQGELANRHVALKVATDLTDEAQTLAQLHHPHIVPIYSVHRTGPLRAVCMPYFGATTLADVLNDVAQGPALPASGEALVSTVNTRRSASHVRCGVRGAECGLEDKSAIPQEGTTTDTLEQLKGLTYIQAVLWLAERLADGLAHAHERGILHLDLKPANILLSDEGQPMLLDFNLAKDTKLQGQAAAASLGGTLPYMAPEHLGAFQGGTRPVDQRSDLYSFGVILYELLTGWHPFPERRGPAESVLSRLFNDRQGPPPRLRNRNPAVSPAVESLVRRCLEPDPARRYQSAAELREDLQRHRLHLPLRHAPEPSLRERADKWRARHPRLVSAGSVGSVAIVLLLGLVLLLAARGHRLAGMEALDSLTQFRADLWATQYLLNAHSPTREQCAAGVAQCRQTLARYGVLEDPQWSQRPDIHALPAAEQQQLRQEIGEVLLLLARATSLQAGQQAASTEVEQVRAALQWNERAEACYSSLEVPQALWAQRAELMRQLGSTTEAEQLRARARQTSLRTPRDHYLAAAEHVAQGRYQEALPLAKEAVAKDPKSFWAWYVLGLAHDGLAQDADTVTCFSICTVLAPESAWAHFNRGLAYLKRQELPRASADFDEAVRLRPEWADAYLNRAIARQGLRQYEPAIADLTRALELGTSHTRAHFMRARVRDLAGDSAGAQRDRAEGRRQEPADEKSWIARGVDRMETEPEAALADFEKALASNPRSRAALQNKAYVLAEKLGRPRDALAVLNEAVALYPDYVAARAGRGILHARLGERKAALHDAEEALARDPQPPTYYQVAGIYALTSRLEPEDRDSAFRLLAAALRKGYGFTLLESDRDLDPIRSRPEFQPLVDAARALHPNLSRPSVGR